MKQHGPGSPSPRATPGRKASFLRIGISFAILLAAADGVRAEVSSLEAFIERYPSAFELFTCGTCHLDFDGPADDLAAGLLADGVGASRNAYGNAFKQADGISHPSSAFQAIEGKDSDGDGATNAAEILAGFHPGYRCDTIDNAVNAPDDIDFYLDPSQPGCGLATTTTLPASTTTLPASTTTTEATATTLDTTTTTLPAWEGCAQPLTSGPLPMASDCLHILRTAVGLTTCTPACICAPKGSLPTVTVDALLCLKASVGQAVTLQCPCDDPGTTTTTTTTTLPTTTSTTTTTLPPSTTTTTTSTTTTTTLVSPAARGKMIYDGRCGNCHSAGSYDTKGFAGNLAGAGNLLVNDLGVIDASMGNLILTDGEIVDLAAFLDGL